MHIVQWKMPLSGEWEDYESPVWRRMSACKIAARQAQKRDTVPDWRVVDAKTGQVILSVSKPRREP